MSIEYTLWMGDIKPWMNELFIQNSFYHFGLMPKSIKLIKDKNLNNPLNYCFINFDSLEKANQALNKLKNKKIPNSNIKFKLNWANKNFDKFKSAYISNIPLEVKDSDLFNFFKKNILLLFMPLLFEKIMVKKITDLFILLMMKNITNVSQK